MGREDSPLRERLVFLVGARRSGTNWLQRILRTHPDIAGVVPETYVFNMGIKPLEERFQHANPGSPMMATMFIEREGFADGVRDLLDRAFLDNLRRSAPEARYILERTPWHVYDLGLIREIYPDARVVHIIRDGRAVARSLMAHDWGPDTMADAAEEWRSSVAAGLATGPSFGDRYRQVFYEKLIADPARGIEELCTWLDLTLDERTHEAMLLEARSEFNVDPRSPGVRADKWRGRISARDLATFDRVAGAQLEALGYEREVASGRDARAEAVRSLLGRARRPRRAWRDSRRRARAGLRDETLHRNHEVVERFQRAVERGRLDEGRSLLAPLVQVHIADGETPRELRGDGAATALLGELAEHEARGCRQLWGRIDGSPNAFTLTAEYERSDRTRWARTLVLIVDDAGLITGANLYRFLLAADAVPV